MKSLELFLIQTWNLSVTNFLRIFLALFFIVISLFPSLAQEEEIQSLVMNDPRVKDILADFPEIHLKSFYAEKHGVWIFEMIHEEYGEVGLVSVSPEKKEILEFNFNIEKIREQPTDDAMEEEESSLAHVMLQFFPHFSGMDLFWFSLVVVLLITGNSKKLLSWRNVDLVLLYSLCPFLILIWTHMKIAFTGIFLITLLLFLRVLFHPKISSSIQNVSVTPSKKAWYLLLAFVIIFHIHTIYTRGVGDVGIWSSIGAEYVYQTGHLPYGTEFGPNCVYGPLMYMLFIPGNIIFPPQMEFGPDGNNVQWGQYADFDMRGIQTTVLLLDLLTLWLLYRIGSRGKEWCVGFLLVFLYAISPYILGIISEMGLERASHVAGTPFILMAFLWRSKPLLSGTMLGIASGMLYYSVFLFPLWAIHYVRAFSFRESMKFVTTFTGVGLICLIFIMLAVQPETDGAFASIQAFIDNAITQQQFSESYGNSPMSFWGQYPALASWGKPLTGILFVFFACVIGLHGEAWNEMGLWSFSAALLVGTQLVLAFAGGTYIGFYLAPLIIVLFGQRENYREVVPEPDL